MALVLQRPWVPQLTSALISLMQALGPGSGGENTPWASTAWLPCEHPGAYLGTDMESCARCSGAHLGTKGLCFYWRIWTDVKGEKGWG